MGDYESASVGSPFITCEECGWRFKVEYLDGYTADEAEAVLEHAKQNPSANIIIRGAEGPTTTVICPSADCEAEIEVPATLDDFARR